MNQEITLLIADDEAEIRTGLRNIINWSQYHISLIGIARNGAEALDMIRFHEPDIVITDIQMPGMDGLEMIHKAKEEQFSSHFIILSGYDDFQYAKTAIRYGVEDYILKPIVVEELKEIIIHLTQEIMNKRNAHLDQLRISQNFSRANRTLIHQRFITEMLRGELTPIHLQEVLSSNDIPLKPGMCAAVVLYLYDNDDSVFESDETFNGSITRTLYFLQTNLSEKSAVIGHDMRTSIIIFLNSTSHEKNIAYFSQLVQELKELHQINAFAAIGDLVDSVDKILESYQIASQIASWHIYPELGNIGDSSLLKLPISYIPVDTIPLINDIRHADLDNLKKDFELYTNSLFTTSKIPAPAYVFSMYHLLITTIRTALSDRNFQSYTGEAYQTMRQFDTFSEIKSWMLKVLLDYSGELSVSLAQSSDPLIEKAVRYIEDHIFDKVCAEDVCQYIGFSKNYFSKYFKEKTNLNFRDYLLDLKITYAQKQLKSRNQSPSELAVLLGYEEYSSFSRAFKARTGFSPIDFQKNQ